MMFKVALVTCKRKMPSIAVCALARSNTDVNPQKKKMVGRASCSEPQTCYYISYGNNLAFKSPHTDVCRSDRASVDSHSFLSLKKISTICLNPSYASFIINISCA